jgi:cytochrome c oxidase subunit II
MHLRTLIYALASAGSLLAPAALTAQKSEPQAPEPKVIEVVARKFEFEPSRIEVEEGEHVRLVVRSADGAHGVEIKKFKVNKLVPRGDNGVTIDFVASAPGTYPILCSEYCGDGHEDMTGTLVVRAKSK